jgi:ubiquinone biosynthesis protein COQ4
MTATTQTAFIPGAVGAIPEIPPPPEHPIDWRRAWCAVRILMREPERTEQAFEVITALAGRAPERHFRRFLTDPHGRLLLAERPSLLAVLSDRRRLEALPAGTLGRTFADFTSAAGIEPRGLVEASEASEARNAIKADPHREFFFDRMRDFHDLQHVLTGYGTDEMGEAANLAFSYAQQPLAGTLLILAAIVVMHPNGGRWACLRHLYRGWRRGRQAAWLATVPFERMLELPLAEARWALRIEPLGV